MTSFQLAAGCALVAFSPSLALLMIFVYSKAQLVIVVTTSAFAELLSCLISSLVHLPFTAIGLQESAFIIIPVAVVSRAFCRCGFVLLYHKVENVIEGSIRSHTAAEPAPLSSSTSTTNERNTTVQTLSETQRLRLEINDVSCGLAAGAGFGGMHTVMLYGTLLSSESGQVGTLYQPSCSIMPSLVNSAFIACMFAFLDIVWMFLTFYGVRRLGGNLFGAAESLSASRALPGPWSLEKGALGGKMALTSVLISHLLASLSTVANRFSDGCLAALPLLAVVLIVTAAFFWNFCKDNYLPEGQRSRIRQTGEHIE